MNPFGVSSQCLLCLLHLRSCGDRGSCGAAFVYPKHVVGERPTAIAAACECIEAAFSPFVVVISWVWVCRFEVIVDVCGLGHDSCPLPGSCTTLKQSLVLLSIGSPPRSPHQRPTVFTRTAYLGRWRWTDTCDTQHKYTVYKCVRFNAPSECDPHSRTESNPPTCAAEGCPSSCERPRPHTSSRSR